MMCILYFRGGRTAFSMGTEKAGNTGRKVFHPKNDGIFDVLFFTVNLSRRFAGGRTSGEDDGK